MNDRRQFLARTTLGLGATLLPTRLFAADAPTNGFAVSETDEQINVTGAALDFTIRKKGYVSGVMAGSLLDKKTGFHDLGYGLDIVDWIMEPGSDEAYRDQLPGDLPYLFNNPNHGKTPKRSIEGPQICTKAKELSPRVIQGRDFIAVTMNWQYRLAAPGKQTGSAWSQALVFPAGKRYFISSDRIASRNASDAMFLRIDMPGHVKHKDGDTFSEVYLSYHGRIPAKEFIENFAPDEKFNYSRGRNPQPKRFIRAYHTRDPKTGADGPWLAGMTLDPSDVYEGWCHQRNYVCFIEEFGGRPIKAGESFSAAFIVGWFDSIEEMEQVYDQYAGHSGLKVTEQGWKLTKWSDQDSPKASARKPTLANVAYGKHERQVLDFYKAESAKPTPVLFFIHGGGWLNGDKSGFNNVAPYLAAGISVVAINYRFIPQAEADGLQPPVIGPLHDAARALQFVRSKAAEWNIDKQRIGASGSSAGACSSLWLAFHPDMADPKSADPVARESTRLWCAAVLRAQTSLDPQQMVEWIPNMNYGAHAFGFKGSPDKKDSAFAEFLAKRETILPWIAEYSPYALVSADDPPIYLYYNTPPAIGQPQESPAHSANFGVKLQEKCRSMGIDCELVYPGAPEVKHMDVNLYLIEKLKS